MKYTINTRKTKKGLAFDLDVRWRGTRYRPLLGFDLSKDQVQQAAVAMIVKIQAGPPQSEVRRGERTLRDVTALFWDSFDVKKRIDRARPKGILENHLLPAFGDRPLTSRITRNIVVLRSAVQMSV